MAARENETPVKDRRTLAVTLWAFVLYWLCRAPATHFDEHIRLAYALLHGRPYIDATPVHEMISSGGHWYSLHPPGSALACLPFVAVLGLSTNQTALSVLFAAVAVGLCWRTTWSVWITAFFAIGTVFFFEATLGASWGMCLTLSTVPTFLALLAVERGDPTWTGIWAGAAMLCRYDLVLTIPCYYALLEFKRRER